MTKQKSWKPYHQFQKEDGYCGVAVIQMALLRAGIRKTQKSIAKSVYINWWGVSRDIMFSYLSKFFSSMNFKSNASIRDISFHSKKGHIVIVNLWDNFEGGEGEGHYCLVSSCDPKAKMIELVDPSESREGIWKIPYKKFKDNWYDTINIDNTIKDIGWFMWIDLESKRQ
jgi:hypothetical protein